MHGIIFLGKIAVTAELSATIISAAPARHSQESRPVSGSAA
jgi:hypothetical protein